ncbi:carnitine/acylcarnitine carrier protein [Capsaspora owczarzaki ATCC 30864]|uniref:Carnitine/acylcarnitine carrier protein n=1 Tax=Capsaspora owczarzaki (strain ATCC 30864) TaxID=595528 RepID=A0A0D2VI86_CAPO3|nr:carnitine/acylcarnitine carrier protein [Capsaspora owczarzaki ATCC 30864]KJE89647.1 carnitine/acylcarnitine carrier protein [Capsaspora owczarzaki ATCC 30864]|eukprot:XP_004365955.2 carnitine/acylcarnitine carrier protein [Capsaspora owczarzaki ATCC 30864]
MSDLSDHGGPPHHSHLPHAEPRFSKMDHFISGSFAGIAQSLIGHPFDTIKVRLQTQSVTNPLFKGPYDCLQQTIRKEGVRALFKGMSSPLVASIVFNSILFGTFEEFKSRLSNPLTGQLSTANFVLSCTATGALESLLYCPLELVKARLQVHMQASAASSAASAATTTATTTTTATQLGPMGMLREVVQQRGIRGLFIGLNVTMLRECPGNVMYFGAYEMFKTHYPATRPETERIIMSGGLTGMLYWTFIYPIDLLKSKVQCDDLQSPRYRGLVHCFRVSLQESGWRGLFVGLSPCILRAFPANGAAFVAFEFSKSFLRSQAEIA